jgi:hypothetical protein
MRTQHEQLHPNSFYSLKISLDCICKQHQQILYEKKFNSHIVPLGRCGIKRSSSAWNLMHVWYECSATLPPYLTAAFISIYKYTVRVNPLHHMHEQIHNI